MSAPSPLRLGIIGCGGLPQGALLPAVATIAELNLVATCDLREEVARSVAERYHASFSTTDYEELLRQDLDAVMVVAPPAVHETVGIAVLESGRHLFVEKPPSMSAEGAGRLAAAARARPELKTTLGTIQRHTPACRLMKEISEREEFGRPLIYQARYCCPGPGMRLDWGLDRDDDRQMLRFFLLDHIIHHIDLARFFNGEIKAVHTLRTDGPDDRYAFLVGLTFASGVVGSLTCCFRAPSFDNEVVLYGDGPAAVEAKNWSTLSYRPPELGVGQRGYADSTEINWSGGIGLHVGAQKTAYWYELRQWATGILEDGSPHATVEDGYQDMLVLEAILESAANGSTVLIPV